MFLHMHIKDVLHVKVCNETSYIANDKRQNSDTFPGSDRNVHIHYVRHFQNSNNYMPKNALQNVHFSSPKHG